jgi:hypothetical protein
MSNFQNPILKRGPNICFFEEQKAETKTEISKNRIKKGTKTGGQGRNRRLTVNFGPGYQNLSNFIF